MVDTPLVDFLSDCFEGTVKIFAGEIGYMDHTDRQNKFELEANHDEISVYFDFRDYGQAFAIDRKEWLTHHGSPESAACHFLTSLIWETNFPIYDDYCQTKDALKKRLDSVLSFDPETFDLSPTE